MTNPTPPAPRIRPTQEMMIAALDASHGFPPGWMEAALQAAMSVAPPDATRAAVFEECARIAKQAASRNSMTSSYGACTAIEQAIRAAAAPRIDTPSALLPTPATIAPDALGFDRSAAGEFGPSDECAPAKVLRELEWDERGECPICRGLNPDRFSTSNPHIALRRGHVAGCRLAAALANTPQSDDGARIYEDGVILVTQEKYNRRIADLVDACAQRTIAEAERDEARASLAKADASAVADHIGDANKMIGASGTSAVEVAVTREMAMILTDIGRKAARAYGLPDAALQSSSSAEAERDALRADLAACRAALEGMLAHSCVADGAAEDKFPEDHDAERSARKVIRALADRQAAAETGGRDDG